MGVAKKISKVMEMVQYLKKDGKVSYGRTSYGYLSEEKITQELNKAFREVGLIIYPSKMDIAKNEGDIAQIIATYRIQDTESDEYIEVQTIGEGQDKGDKKMNKAMTAAFKYAQRQSFMIPTGDDPDHISTAELTDDESEEESGKSGDNKNKKNGKKDKKLVTDKTMAKIDEWIDTAHQQASNYSRSQIKSKIYKDFAKEKGWEKFFISEKSTTEKMSQQFLNYLKERLG